MSNSLHRSAPHEDGSGWKGEIFPPFCLETTQISEMFNLYVAIWWRANLYHMSPSPRGLPAAAPPIPLSPLSLTPSARVLPAVLLSPPWLTPADPWRPSWRGDSGRWRWCPVWWRRRRRRRRQLPHKAPFCPFSAGAVRPAASWPKAPRNSAGPEVDSASTLWGCLLGPGPIANRATRSRSQLGRPL